MPSIVNLTIRPFEESRDADYAAFIAVQNSVTPEYVGTVEELKDHDSRRDPKCHNARWLAEENGSVVGVGSYSQSPWAYHPHRFRVRVAVLPEREGNGIGSALYEQVRIALKPLKPMSLHINVREDWERGQRFAAERGFVEEARDWESRLDVAAFDPSPWQEAAHKPEAHGITIRSYAQLADDPDRDRKVYALISKTFVDIPSVVELTPPPFERYEDQILKGPNFMPEGLIIAIDEKTRQYVGSSEVSRKPSEDYWNTGLTGVLRDYRRMGIALALKLRVLAYAKECGIAQIRTDNATTNRPMLSINEALGFVKQPAWVSLVNNCRIV